MNDNNKTIVSPASVEHLQDQNFTRTTFENLIPMRFDQMKNLTAKFLVHTSSLKRDFQCKNVSWEIFNNLRISQL